MVDLPARQRTAHQGGQHDAPPGVVQLHGQAHDEFRSDPWRRPIVTRVFASAPYFGINCEKRITSLILSCPRTIIH
jgi:hypothetical protein